MSSPSLLTSLTQALIRRTPAIGWFRSYHRADLPSDLVAGLIVAIVLVPQSIAYAMLAGLPAQVGLYAGVLPLAIYAVWGSSSSLAVGPVAIISLLVGSALSQLAIVGSSQYIAYAVTLALLVGLIQAGMGLLRLGFVVNFLSHAVLSGFTSAAALVIVASQLKHILGIDIARGQPFFQLVRQLLGQVTNANPATVMLGVSGILLLLAFHYFGERVFRALRLPSVWSLALSKIGPFAAVVAGALATKTARLDRELGVAVVGNIPAGLPRWSLPSTDLQVWRLLLPTALAIALMGFLGSYAVAKVLAARSRERVRANQELLALGLANLGAAVTGALPVAGGFGRSMVNFSSGARSRLASLTTATLLVVTLAFLTPLFFYLPRASLAAIIIVAASKLIDVSAVRRFWNYSKADALALLGTFTSVLLVGVEEGILVGATFALVLHLWRTTQPHMAIVGRVGTSEHFRNVLRHSVHTWPELLLVRIDESLYFANVQRLVERLLRAVSEKPKVEHLVLIASAVNFIDGSALETLDSMIGELRTAGVTLHFAEVKGPVMDRLERTTFLDHMGHGRVFLSTQEAVSELVGDHPLATATSAATAATSRATAPAG